MKVYDLKRVLEYALDDLENYDDNDSIVLEQNTYGLRNATYFFGKSGYNGGYIDLYNIQIEEKENCYID